MADRKLKLLVVTSADFTTLDLAYRERNVHYKIHRTRFSGPFDKDPFVARTNTGFLKRLSIGI